MRRQEFEKLYPQYQRVIAAIARKLARQDDDLMQDLEQEGAIALWELDLRKATSNRDAWIRQAVKFRMIDHLRRRNPRAYESLDAMLEGGAQLIQETTGEYHMLSNYSLPRLDDEESE